MKQCNGTGVICCFQSVPRADSSLVDIPGKKPEHGGLTNFGKVSWVFPRISLILHLRTFFPCSFFPRFPRKPHTYTALPRTRKFIRLRPFHFTVLKKPSIRYSPSLFNTSGVLFILNNSFPLPRKTINKYLLFRLALLIKWLPIHLVRRCLLIRPQDLPAVRMLHVRVLFRVFIKFTCLRAVT